MDVLIHTLGTGEAHSPRRVSVPMEGKRRGAMSEVFLHCLDVVIVSQTIDYVCMAKIVKSGGREANVLGNLFEIDIYGLIAKVASDFRDKNKVVRILRRSFQKSLEPHLLFLRLILGELDGKIVIREEL